MRIKIQVIVPPTYVDTCVEDIHCATSFAGETPPG
jgi:hypothetical protein